MPFPVHQRLTFTGIFGSLAAPQEIWSVRLNTQNPQMTETEQQAYVPLVRARFATRIMPLLSSQVWLTRTRVSTHDEAGKTFTSPMGAYAQSDDNTQVQGGRAVNTVLPLQTALAVSLESARDGVTGKGRIFLPVIDRPVQAGAFTLSDTVTQEFANGVANLIIDLNALQTTLAFDNGAVVVLSSKGYSSIVTGVNVGNVLDTMRSRRNALPETRVRASV